MSIPYTRPSITELEVAYATDAAANGWGENCYQYIERFEAELSNRIGTGGAVATSSATGALHLGMAALGIGPGDEVILADSNWIATVAPVVHLGAKPVFVDILPDTWCIDPDRVHEAITPRTKAVIATHLYGNLCDLDRLIPLCERHNLFLIEDAAEAIGGLHRGRHAGSVGTFGAFSFHGTKTITTGEGGALVSSDLALLDRVRMLNNHGRALNESRQFWPSLLGYKYRMSNVQAAIGCAQLERWQELTQRKIEILEFYRDRLVVEGIIEMNPKVFGNVEAAWMPNVVLGSKVRKGRDELGGALRAAGVDARVFFWPLSSLPMFETLDSRNPVAADIAGRSINLPSFHDISVTEMNLVIDVVQSVVS